MHFSLSAITATLAIIGLTSASPIAEPRAVGVPARYKLQTKVVGNNTDCGSNKNGLWVTSWHTGAGLGDAALITNKTVAMEGYLNDTQQLFTYAGSPGPWPMGIGYGPYQEFNTVTISIAESYITTGFYFNETGLQWNQTGAGWLACDWWHGTPQLFSSLDYFYGNASYPTACSIVQLYPIAI